MSSSPNKRHRPRSRKRARRCVHRDSVSFTPDASRLNRKKMKISPSAVSNTAFTDMAAPLRPAWRERYRRCRRHWWTHHRPFSVALTALCAAYATENGNLGGGGGCHHGVGG